MRVISEKDPGKHHKPKHALRVIPLLIFLLLAASANAATPLELSVSGRTVSFGNSPEPSNVYVRVTEEECEPNLGFGENPLTIEATVNGELAGGGNHSLIYDRVVTLTAPAGAKVMLRAHTPLQGWSQPYMLPENIFTRESTVNLVFQRTKVTSTSSTTNPSTTKPPQAPPEKEGGRIPVYALVLFAAALIGIAYASTKRGRSR